MAVDVNDPAGWDGRIAILPQERLGWGTGIHIGRIYDPAQRGWFLLSTYGDGGEPWSVHQLFMAEVADVASDPRLWRLTPTFKADDGYWTPSPRSTSRRPGSTGARTGTAEATSSSTPRASAPAGGTSSGLRLSGDTR